MAEFLAADTVVYATSNGDVDVARLTFSQNIDIIDFSIASLGPSPTAAGVRLLVSSGLIAVAGHPGSADCQFCEDTRLRCRNRRAASSGRLDDYAAVSRSLAKTKGAFLHRLPLNAFLMVAGLPLPQTFDGFVQGSGARIAAVIYYRDDLIFATPRELSGPLR